MELTQQSNSVANLLVGNGKPWGSPPHLVQDELGRTLNGLQEIVALSYGMGNEMA